MIQADLLKWLSCTIDNEVSLEDLKNGLPLLQLLSLISPASVNLGWNTTLEAQECPNISLRNYSNLSLIPVSLAKGLKYLKENPPFNMPSRPLELENLNAEISAISQTVIHDAKSGQIEACVGILKIMYNIWRIAKAEYGMLSNSEIIESHAVIPARYVPSEKSFKPMVRWLLYKSISALKNSNFDPCLKAELLVVLETCFAKVLGDFNYRKTTQFRMKYSKCYQGAIFTTI
jgi:hypothetical protein